MTHSKELHSSQVDEIPTKESEQTSDSFVRAEIIKSHQSEAFYKFHMHRLIQESFSIISSQKITQELQDISKKLSEEVVSHAMKELSLSTIDSIEISKDFITLNYNEAGENKQEVYAFSDLSGRYVGSGKEDVQEYMYGLKHEISSSLTQMNIVLSEIEDVFYKNELEDWDMIDENEEKSLLVLQKKVDTIISQYSTNRLRFVGMTDQIDSIFSTLQERYLELVLGIGDMNEGGAAVFEKSRNDIHAMIEVIIAKKSPSEMLSYMRTLHKKMDDNNYQAQSVKEAYKSVSKFINMRVFASFQNKGATDEEFLALAKLVSGRDYALGKIEYSMEIDYDLKDPLFSNEVIMYLFDKKDGVFDRIEQDPNSKILVEDDELNGRSPIMVLEDMELSLDREFGDEQGSEILKGLGFEHLYSLSDMSYEDLRIDDQVRISLLARMINELDSSEIQKAKDSGDKTRIGSVLKQLLEKMAIKATEHVTEEVNSNFDFSLSQLRLGKDSGDYSQLSDTQKEVFDLYQDINGNGLFNPSDETWEVYGTIGKIGVSIVAAIMAAVVLVPAGSVIVVGAVAGTAGALAGIALNPKGFDSFGEAATDLTTEIALGTVSGAAGGALFGGIGSKTGGEFMKRVGLSGKAIQLVQTGLGVEGAKHFSAAGVRNKGIFVFDLALLGVASEAGRAYWVNNVFHSNSIYDKKNK